MTAVHGVAVVLIRTRTLAFQDDLHHVGVVVGTELLFVPHFTQGVYFHVVVVL